MPCRHYGETRRIRMGTDLTYSCGGRTWTRCPRLPAKAARLAALFLLDRLAIAPSFSAQQARLTMMTAQARRVKHVTQCKTSTSRAQGRESAWSRRRALLALARSSLCQLTATAPARLALMVSSRRRLGLGRVLHGASAVGARKQTTPQTRAWTAVARRAR